MPKPILSTRSRIKPAQAEKVLKAYAHRLPLAEAAKRAGLSLNTVYEQYSRLRWRMIETGYYTDAALSKDESGLSEWSKEGLRARRGLEDGDIYANAAEVIEWAEEWPPGTVLRQMRKIIELTGPLDKPLSLSDPQEAVVAAYVRYARTKLIHDRVAQNAKTDLTRSSSARRTDLAAAKSWTKYRAACRRLGSEQ